ncbi:MerR family transcriptional regulator [Jeotgalibacillus haloalkalitolerans]|uniref:MerR family transcriptional regulator n=1 Tax=Jeotgalibacillus haloalkalitolerans TaxID=3104292 RepID=A0ABU5KJN6_9BACL|nr:MerR family transcriptional regulator [Jeotgalibacillus sp. HH7-29]MDZ5711438.1 MerR family transcriptional regulator [Jeotgalibacillus sp. HH7-29]
MKTIREVADLFGVSTRTVRYYEELGLIRPERSEGNIRLYGSRDMAKLKLVFRGKRFGFSLEEIKEMVLLFDLDRSGKKQLERTVEYGHQRIAEIEEKIIELEEMKDEMKGLLLEFEQKLREKG